MPAPLVCIGEVDALEQSGGELLDPDERARIGAIRHPLARSRSRAAAVLLARALAYRLGDSPRARRVFRDAGCRPVHAAGASVSVSHSGAWVACAVADGPAVGIDLQVIGGKHDVAAIAAQYFSEPEAAWLSRQTRERFFQLWVLKEAYLKALGLGLAGGLNRLRCVIEDDWIDGTVAGGGPVAFGLYQSDDFCCGVAVPGGHGAEQDCLQYDPRQGWVAPRMAHIASGTCPDRDAA